MPDDRHERQTELLLQAARGIETPSLGEPFVDVVMRSVARGESATASFAGVCQRFLLIASPLTAGLLVYLLSIASLNPLNQLDGYVELLTLMNL